MRWFFATAVSFSFSSAQGCTLRLFLDDPVHVKIVLGKVRGTRSGTAGQTRIINSRDNRRGGSHHPGPHEDEEAIKSSDEEMYNNKVGRRHIGMWRGAEEDVNPRPPPPPPSEQKTVAIGEIRPGCSWVSLACTLSKTVSFTQGRLPPPPPSADLPRPQTLPAPPPTDTSTRTLTPLLLTGSQGCPQQNVSTQLWRRGASGDTASGRSSEEGGGRGAREATLAPLLPTPPFLL